MTQSAASDLLVYRDCAHHGMPWGPAPVPQKNRCSVHPATFVLRKSVRTRTTQWVIAAVHSATAFTCTLAPLMVAAGL